MANPARPSTPTTSRPPAPTPTGTWKHPRFDEIARRQNASTFSDRNVKQVLYNVGGLLALWALEQFARTQFPNWLTTISALQPSSTYLNYIVRIILVFNIIAALLPLIRQPDDLSDIPLTPAQRKLLGLAPSSAPPTPGSQYITPPRYPRSTTPHSGSPSSNYSNSPLSGKTSSAQPLPKGSPFSPSSPLLHKAIGGGLGGTRRSSWGSPSPLGPGGSRSEAPGTPSPSTGKGASISLNNKWLYEKGRSSGGSSRLFA